MARELEDIIKQHIHSTGPMDVSTFMQYALTHPQYGYYTTRDPFGVTGDFTTAPEISQLFGEMIGVYIRAFYEQMGPQPHIHLVECGAGRGTMMRDMLRVILPHVKASIHIVEVSETLRAIQKQTIGRDDIIWHNDISTLPIDAPLIVVGNEFLDALPIHQAIYDDGKWYEHEIGVIDHQLSFMRGELLYAKYLPTEPRHKIFEFSPQRQSVHRDICDRILKQKGLLLWVDYGFDAHENKASLQAVKQHKYVDVLQDVGEADITSLVDFESLISSTPSGLEISPVTSQAEFLKQCGIDERCHILCDKNPDKRDMILSGYHRLIDADQMGTLFKVLSVSKI